MDPPDESTELRSVQHSKLAELFTADRFPTTTEAILEEFGDLVVEYPHSTEPLATILKYSGSETYADSLQLEHAILNGVSRGAVGRPRYSDRGLERDDRERMPISF